MIVETSAVMAILLGEPEAVAFLEAMNVASHCLLSAANLVQASSALIRRGHLGIEEDLDRWIERAGMVVIPVDEEQAKLARHAYRVFGRGRHRAGLNFGDCFAYALAKITDDVLLFKGNDFIWTDVRKA